MTRPDRWPDDLAEFVFDTDEVIPLTELADSFRALDNLFARGASGGARLAVAEIRKGSIVAVLAPFVPLLGPAITFVSTSVDVAEFVRRLRDGLNAFAGIENSGRESAAPPENQVATEIAALVKPLAGRSGSRLDIAHIKYRSETGDRTVELEVSYGSEEIDRIAVNAMRQADFVPHLEDLTPHTEQPSLLRKVVLTLQQTNTGPAKVKGKTGDRGIIQSVTDKPLPVYFAKTMDDLKMKMVGSSSNPFRKPFSVDVLVAYEADEPRSYTVIDVHRAVRQRKKKGPPDLLTNIA